MNILQRLILIILLVALPLGILQTLGLRADRSAELKEISDRASRTAARAGAEQRRIVDGAKQLLTALSHLPSIRNGDSVRCNTLLRGLGREFTTYSAIGVSDKRGRIWCSSVRPGTDVSERPFFKRTIDSRRFTTGDYVVGRVTGRRTLSLSLPFTDKAGDIEGVLIAGLDLDRLAQDLAEVELPADSKLLIAGPDGNVLIDLPGGRQVGHRLPRHFLPYLSATESKVIDMAWLTGSDHKVALLPPTTRSDMPFLIAVGVDRESALAAVHKRFLQDVFVVLLTLAVAFLLSWWFATRFVSHPLEKLGSVMRAWWQGDSKVRVGQLGAGAEIDELAQAFDTMADVVEERERGLRMVLDSTTDSVITFDADWLIIFVNERVRERLPGRDLVGQTVWQVFPKRTDRRAAAVIRDAMIHRRRVSLSVEHSTLGGHFEINAFPHEGGGMTLFMRDVTEQVRAREQLQQQARHDSLTELPNRGHALSVARERLAAGTLSAMVLFDLDGFKHINDSLGHPAGDDMLREVGRRLACHIGPDDMIARLGGDEFLALLSYNSSRDSIETCRRLLRSLANEPFEIQGRERQITSSAGMVLVLPDDLSSVDELLTNADIVLYRAKDAGGGKFCVYNRRDRLMYNARQQLEEDLAGAVEAGEFELYFQPQILLQNSSVVGAEALLRWRHPRRGLLTPDAFIEALAGSRHAQAAGEWILDEACRQAALWWRAGYKLRVGVNLFNDQVRSKGLVEVVHETLRRHGLPGDALELELTENIALTADTSFANMLLKLHMLNVRVAFDDFGTGFASLTTLKTVPVQRLKIDRSFVEHLPGNEHDQAIVEAVLALARTLDLEVIAEGVETEVQESYLRARGCLEAQGYLYARPMPAKAFFTYLTGSAEAEQRASPSGVLQSTAW